MLAKAGQTPTNYWHIGCLAAGQSVVMSLWVIVKHIYQPPYTQRGRLPLAVILKQYFQLSKTVAVSFSQPRTSCFPVCFPLILGENDLRQKHGHMIPCY